MTGQSGEINLMHSGGVIGMYGGIGEWKKNEWRVNFGALKLRNRGLIYKITSYVEF